MTKPLFAVALVLVAACDRSAKQAVPEPDKPHAAEGSAAPADHAAHGSAAAAPADHADHASAAGTPGCGKLTGDNPVMTEMRQLECALQQAIVALGRDQLASIPPSIHVVHEAKQATAHAIETGAWKPAKGGVEAFVALDETFHKELEALVKAAGANDHAATGAALGRALAQCQGCHATFRAVAPPAAPTP